MVLLLYSQKTYSILFFQIWLISLDISLGDPRSRLLNNLAPSTLHHDNKNVIQTFTVLFIKEKYWLYFIKVRWLKVAFVRKIWRMFTLDLDYSLCMLGKLNFSESLNIFGRLHIKNIRISVKFGFVQNILTVLEFYPFFWILYKMKKKISFLSQDILPSERFLNLTGWLVIS